ncbi:unnamed protein product [Periconia digitata]|uniref:Uncharacterized protein n=1 Tax=Periconia digitata TaxID=1303443 RepID=A0A9W4UJ84_9PLEO|nr:unnamed protein product [Periconia digitata]
MMKWLWLSISTVGILCQILLGVVEAQITPGPALPVRQESKADPTLLGWVSTSGASKFSDQRVCDFPSTVSRSGAYAKCCAASVPCNLYTTCSGNVLVAPSTSVPCEQGICNTGVIVASTGTAQQQGVSNIECWATGLGTKAFWLVTDVNNSATATPTTASATSTTGRASSSTAFKTNTEESTPSSSESSVSGASSPSPSNAALALPATRLLPFLIIVGFFEDMFA